MKGLDWVRAAWPPIAPQASAIFQCVPCSGQLRHAKLAARNWEGALEVKVKRRVWALAVTSEQALLRKEDCLKAE